MSELLQWFPLETTQAKPQSNIVYTIDVNLLDSGAPGPVPRYRASHRHPAQPGTVNPLGIFDTREEAIAACQAHQDQLP